MLGICTSLEKAHLAVEAGFDYVEISASEIAQQEPWTTEPYQNLPIQVVNLFFPGGVTLWDHGKFNPYHYTENLAPRLAELGVSIAVIGSGGQRRLAEEAMADVVHWHPEKPQEPESVMATLFHSLQLLCESQLKIAPESLNRTETNVGTDCGSFARTLAERGIGYTADLYHILREWDFDGREGGLPAPTQAFWEEQLPFAPLHVHVAQLEGRRAPEPGDPMLEGGFARLRQLGYTGRFSLECNGLEPGEYGPAIQNLKSYMSFAD
ncbi:MAG TPA: TIM barrel protein [Fimbriimonas sp.]|nr:TIM barrel protein [Fimbriimonas sp.]